mgnify:CR=1 FL=1
MKKYTNKLLIAAVSVMAVAGIVVIVIIRSLAQF